MTPLLPFPDQPGLRLRLPTAMQMNCQCYTELESYRNTTDVTRPFDSATIPDDMPTHCLDDVRCLTQ